jgi:hypothetical protein
MSSWRCFPFVDSTPRAYRLKASNAAPSSSTSTGTFPIARLAYAQAKEAGIALEPLLKKAGLTLHQIEEPSIRLRSGIKSAF